MRPSRSASQAPIPAFPDPGEPLRTLVRGAFPGGVAVAPASDGRQSVEETRRLLSEGQSLIYGAAFAAEGILATFDVLQQRNGRWYGYLFRPSTRVKEWHLTDAALHEYVIRQSGIQLADVYVLLLNMQYVRRGALSAPDLFQAERITRRLRAQQSGLRGRMQMLKRRAAKSARDTPAGEPPPVSPQRGRAAPAPDRTGTPGDNAPVALEVDRAALGTFLEGLRYPLYFMDFEAYQTAVPEYDGHWPFRQLPFQFSVHRIDAPGGPMHHEAFIAPPKAEPTGPFVEALLRATGSEGSVLVYNLDSEQLILDHLEGDHPRWAAPIEALRRRLVDLMLPFSRRYIQVPGIGNKISLKYMLPALVPEMSYALLVIGSGDEANQAYNALRGSDDPAFIEKTCADLLDYCAVDTLAMVKILEKMRELAAG
ncbi:MAG TPA: DUF2779 domain-containing protein [Chitinophagaceae bacterium]|nr:DUF2779 domain-containing protein [Chitinophagaceae bacterium]